MKLCDIVLLALIALVSFSLGTFVGKVNADEKLSRRFEIETEESHYWFESARFWRRQMEYWKNQYFIVKGVAK